MILWNSTSTGAVLFKQHKLRDSQLKATEPKSEKEKEKRDQKIYCVMKENDQITLVLGC